MMRVHQRIRRYRLDHGIKQTWVAERLGVNVKTLNGIEMGHQQLKADFFEAICRVLGVEPAYFFGPDFLDFENASGASGEVAD